LADGLCGVKEAVFAYHIQKRTMNSILNLALIGVGRIGRIHAGNIATRIPSARLSGIADVNLEAALQVADQFGVPLAVADYRDLLRDLRSMQ